MWKKMSSGETRHRYMLLMKAFSLHGYFNAFSISAMLKHASNIYSWRKTQIAYKSNAGYSHRI